jgi:hypothetical protein
MSFGAKSLNPWAVSPPPASNTKDLPEPLQSSTSNLTLRSTLINRVMCGEGSFKALALWEKRGIAGNTSEIFPDVDDVIELFVCWCPGSILLCLQ